MKEDDLVIRCLNCGTKNRIPEGRLNDRPICGKCHACLDDMIIRCLRCGTKNRMPENRFTERPICGRCGATLVVEGAPVKPMEISDATFLREVLTYAGSVLVDCWAPWCGPCRAVEPIVEELAAKYAGGIKVTKLNVDENPLTASQYNIRNIPTMLLFKEGKLINTLVGALPKEDVERNILAVMRMN